MKIRKLFSEVIIEDAFYEYKAIISDKEIVRWAKTFVAFSNGKGGTIFVGVSNDGEAFGLPLDEIDKIKNLVAVTNDRHIFPHITYSYMLKRVDSKAELYVLAIRIFPSDSIVRFRDGDFNETVYVKGDGNSVVAKPEDILLLGKRKYGVDNYLTKIPYEEDKWSEFLKLCNVYRENHSAATIKELQNMEIVTPEGFVLSGFEMFKDDYDGDDTRIHLRIFNGLSKSDEVIDKAEYKGSIARSLHYSFDFIKRNIKHGYKKTNDGGRNSLEAYPFLAVREALVNAVAHRDYSIHGSQIDVNIFANRIEITSPGSWILPKPFSSYEVGTIPSIRRNQIISACLEVVHIMERGGTGFKTIFDCYINTGKNRKPQINSYDGFFIIRLFDLSYRTLNSKPENNIKERFNINTNPYFKIILETLKKSPSTRKELQDLTNYQSRDKFVSAVINPLLAAGKIIRVGNPNSPTLYYKIIN